MGGRDMAYDVLAKYYDDLMSLVDYKPWLKLLSPHLKPNDIVLDMGCGTGTLAALLLEKGYQVIAADASESMLAEAQKKITGPLFLHQKMEKLDLYGTVRAIVCSLDGMNYVINTESFREVIRRAHLFLEEGCPFLFDLKTPESLKEMDGKCNISQTEKVFCAWESSWHDPLCRHEITLFEKSGDKWNRSTEMHMQRAYDLDYVTKTLHSSGFREVYVRHDILPEEGRVFFLAWK
jgi:SAM-dependent methyltransferase